MPSKGLEKLKITRKSGNEKFYLKDKELEYDILSFWRWAFSNLATNNLRGHLAEFILATELGLADGVRSEWDSSDLLTPSGIRIEVKSAAYLQTWKQDKISSIRFSISPARCWDENTHLWTMSPQRNSDVYIFCLLKHKQPSTFDPISLDQWSFYVLPTQVLNTSCQNQKTIGLKVVSQFEI